MLLSDSILQNRYRVIRQLGAGGMGTVYEAFDERLETTVALKECHFTEERLRKQFEREARLLARLRHSAITRVIDHFSEGDGQFLVMDYIVGDDLLEMLKRRGSPFQPGEVLRWADQLLDALDYLHHQDPPVIHRDIKPHNLKLTTKGQIMLLDFGLAKGFAGQISRVTTSGSIFGYTPNYAPLEQIQGTGTDPRSDLYSLAATIYHLATGVVPPDVLTRLTATTDGLPDPLQLANEVNPEVSVNVAAVLARALSIGRNQRLASAAEMQKLLREANQFPLQTTGGTAETVAFLPSTVASPVPSQRNPEQGTIPLLSTPTGAVPAKGPITSTTSVTKDATTLEQRKSGFSSPGVLGTYNSTDVKGFRVWWFAIPAVVILVIIAGVFLALQQRTSVTNPDQTVAANISNQNDSTLSSAQNSSNQNSVSTTTPVSTASSPTPEPIKSRPTPSPIVTKSEAPGSAPTPMPKPASSAPVSGGVLNGKAISLPKPAYPAIAKAAHASGTVSVQVTIDESGNVISAQAISGHPLLQAVSVSAARQATFSPTRLAGQPVKVTGVINYNFVAQ